MLPPVVFDPVHSEVGRKASRLQGYPETASIHKRLACAASLCLWQTRSRGLRQARQACPGGAVELAFAGTGPAIDDEAASVDDIRKSSSARWVDLAREMSSLLSSLSAQHDQLGRLTDEAVGALADANFFGL